jgi:hypothetical protein
MLSEHVVEGIHMIDDAYVNWFLVEEGQKLTVVDTGHPSSWKSLQQALPTLGRSISRHLCRAARGSQARSRGWPWRR